MAQPQPAYRLHRRSGQAVVTLSDCATGKRRDVYLGRFDSPQSRELHHRVLARWARCGGSLEAMLSGKRATAAEVLPNVAAGA